MASAKSADMVSFFFTLVSFRDVVFHQLADLTVRGRKMTDTKKVETAIRDSQSVVECKVS